MPNPRQTWSSWDDLVSPSRFGALPEASYPVSQYIPARTLPSSKMAMVKIIEEEAEAADLPPEICMAMIANARAESNFNPEAIGDKDRTYTSIGLFQLNGAPNAAGAGMSVEERMNPHTNTRTIIRELKSHGSMGKWSKPPYAAEHPLTAWKRGVRDAGHLTAMFRFYVERPEYSFEGDELRRSYAATFFPDFTRQTSVPRPGSALPDPDVTAGSTPSSSSPPSPPWYTQAYEWLFGPETGESVTWLAEDSGIGLEGVKEGTIPVGTYTVTLEGRSIGQTVSLLEAGTNYGAHYAINDKGKKVVRFTPR